MMLCQQILGNIGDSGFKGRKIDYVDIEWYEAFKRIHRKTTRDGTEIGIRLDDRILTRGIRQGDVLWGGRRKCNCSEDFRTAMSLKYG